MKSITFVLRLNNFAHLQCLTVYLEEKTDPALIRPKATVAVHRSLI
jgi:hypothetical protein